MNRKYTMALMLFMGLYSLLAQEQPGNRKKADEYFMGFEYGKAVLLYQKLVDKKNPRLEDMARLAFSGYQLGDHELAVNWYARVVEDPQSSADHLLAYARALKQNMQYQQAKEAFERYIALTGKREELALELAGCDQAIKWMASPSPHSLINEGSINTPLSEFGAFPVGDTVFYTGEAPSTFKRYSWTGNSFLRIRYATKGDSLLVAPRRFKPLEDDNRYHMGPISGSKTGDLFFVTQTHVGKAGELDQVGNRKYRTNRLELIIYTRDGKGKWTPRPFEHNKVGEYSVGHASLSPDGQLLYFVSDRPGSLGGTDIWFSQRKADGSWGEPQHGGAQINSVANELFPHLAGDGTLYYSSDGFVGMGGLDVYKSEGSKSNWSAPENLRYPLNSSGDDFAFVSTHSDGEPLTGYMASNRPRGRGGDDIYAVSRTTNSMILLLEGRTYEGQGKDIPLPGATVSLKGMDQTVIAKKVSDGSGALFFDLEPEGEYRLLGQKAKYYSDSLVFSAKGLSPSDTLRLALHLEPLSQIGKKFVLQNIHYDFNRYDLRKDAMDLLNELVRIMRNNPTLKIELSSHTDSRGGDTYNMDLSQKRAESVVDFLVSRGIARDRMKAMGYGETQLLNPCSQGIECPEEKHQQNRRTEVKILDF